MPKAETCASTIQPLRLEIGLSGCSMSSQCASYVQPLRSRASDWPRYRGGSLWWERTKSIFAWLVHYYRYWWCISRMFLALTDGKLPMATCRYVIRIHVIDVSDSIYGWSKKGLRESKAQGKFCVNDEMRRNGIDFVRSLNVWPTVGWVVLLTVLRLMRNLTRFYEGSSVNIRTKFSPK